MKTIRILVALMIVAGLISACQKKVEPTPELEKLSITLDWTPNTNHTGIYVAKELGYFTEQGLDVVIQQPGQASPTRLSAPERANSE